MDSTAQWIVVRDEPGEDALYDVYPPGEFEESLFTCSDPGLAQFVVDACNAAGPGKWPVEDWSVWI